MKEKRPINVPKMLNRNDSSFVKLMSALDGQLRMLRSAGIVPNQSEVFTKDLEQRLWESGVLGRHLSKALLNAVFFLNGKGFCLRGVHKQYSL